MCRGVYIPQFKINPLIFCCPLVNKHTVNYEPSPSQLVSRIHHLIFLWTTLILHISIYFYISKGFISRIFLDFFLKPIYSTMITEKFQIHSVKITGKYICESKNWICSFLLMAPSFRFLSTPPSGFWHYPPGRRKLPTPPEQRFLKFFSWAERGKRITELEKIPKLTRVLVTYFDKLRHQ